MRRFATLVFLLFLAIPAGITVSGCTRNPAANYCNGLGYGPKITDLYSITLQPQNTGISLAFGQTQTVSAPTGYTCKPGTTASVSNFAYGTTNNQLVDVSPKGTICAGSWNRNSGGGIDDYTICSAPNPLPTTNGLPYAKAYITASAQGVTSNPVAVYVHAPVTSISLVAPSECLSQSEQAQLDSEACYAGPGNKQYELCAPSSVKTYSCKDGTAPGVSSVPSCSGSIGTLTYTAANSNVGSIDPETNKITAQQPGTSVITAALAQSASSAGFFSTCPPASISVSVNGSTTGTVTQGVTQNLVTNVVDTKGHTITGLVLDYQSTNPMNLSVTAGGSINASFPGSASIYAICQPGTCNPAPINELGIYGTGLAVASNAVNLTVPGTASSFVWLGAPGQSRYFVPIELISGTVGSTVRLPYVPNSMVMDLNGTNLYFGSDYELMIYSTSGNAITTQNPGVPGVVLAVSPNGGTVLINDPKRKLFYLYSTGSSSSTSTFSGTGTAAQWTPDGRTLYITDTASAGTGHTNTLYVYNGSTGWNTYSLASSGGAVGPKNLAVTVPSIGAYVSGSPTVAHTYCPSGFVGNYNSMSFYPQQDGNPKAGDSVNIDTEVLAATADGNHILGLSQSGNALVLSDVAITLPSHNCLPAQASKTYPGLGDPLQPLALDHTLNQYTLTVNSTGVGQVVTSQAAVSGSSKGEPNLISFVTYQGTTAGAALPYYIQPAGSSNPTGTVGYVTFAGSGASSITAPVAGAFSPDNTTFFVSTSGDNQVHYIDTSTLKDTQQISPNLPACNPGADPGCTLTAPSTNPVPATVIVTKPRATT